MADNELVKTLDAGLPDIHERRRQEYFVESIHRDVAATREIFDSRIGRHDYSDSYPSGPNEFSIDIDTSDVEAKLAVSNFHLGSIDKSTSSAAKAGWEGVHQLTLVREGTDELPEIRVQLEHLNDTAMVNVGATVLGAGIVAHQVAGLRTEIGELGESLSEGFGALSCQLGDVSVQIGELKGVVAEGFADLRHDLRHGQRNIVRAVNNGTKVIGRIFKDGFVLLAGEMASIRKEQRDGLSMVVSIFQDFNHHQEQRHVELVGTIRDVAEHRNTLDADERYRFALQQFQVGNYTDALKEIDKALEAQSTHLPSLILFGKICALRAEWARAKDSFFKAAQLAKLNRDGRTYELAVLELVEVEKQVGNKDQAESFKLESINNWGHNTNQADQEQDIPVGLYFEYYKPGLSNMADAIIDTDFSAATDHFNYNDMTYYPLRAEPKFDVENANRYFEEDLKRFIKEWDPKLRKMIIDLRNSFHHYKHDPNHGWDHSLIRNLGDFLKNAHEKMYCWVNSINNIFEVDPCHAASLSLNFFKTLHNYLDRHIAEVFSELEPTYNGINFTICPFNEILNNRWANYYLQFNFPLRQFYEVVDPYIYSDKRPKPFEVLKSKLDKTYQENSADWNYDKNPLEDFGSASLGFKAACVWIRDLLELDLKNSSLSTEKKRDIMRRVLASYNGIHELYERFRVPGSKVTDEDDLSNLTEQMTLIDRVITNTVRELRGDPFILVEIENLLRMEKRKFKIAVDQTTGRHRRLFISSPKNKLAQAA